MSKTSKSNKEIKSRQKNTESLTYEESLQSLDLLLGEIQSESIPIADLQKRILEGKVYLKHCEKLLNNFEQSIVELDPEDLNTPKKD